MQTVTSNNQSSFNSETNVQLVSVFSKSNAKSNPVSPIRKFKNYNQVFRISQFLTNFSKFFSNSQFNLLYAEKKFRICYKSTLEKINYNLKNIQTVPNCQIKYQSFKFKKQ